LINDLDENDINYNRITEYLQIYNCYDGYNHLIVSFSRIVRDEERRRLIEQGRKLFIPEVIQHWDAG